MISDYYSYKDVVFISIQEQDIPVLLLALLFLHKEYILLWCYKYVMQLINLQEITVIGKAIVASQSPSLQTTKPSLPLFQSESPSLSNLTVLLCNPTSASTLKISVMF